MSSERISNEDFRTFAGEFKNESDRAAVVLAAAKPLSLMPRSEEVSTTAR